MKEYFVLMYETFTDSGKPTFARSLFEEKNMALLSLSSLGGALYRYDTKRAANKGRYQRSVENLKKQTPFMRIVDPLSIPHNNIKGVCDNIFEVDGTKVAKILIGEHVNHPKYIGSRVRGDGLGITDGYIFV